MSRSDRIRVGIGGWTFEPWRGRFYPAGLPHARELEYASRQVTAIEINGTYYRLQNPDTFARWHDETPDEFVFSLKGPRYVTNRRVLAEAGPAIERFLGSGLARLERKLGPVNWQFLPTKRYDADDFQAFLQLLPPEVEGRALRHVVEVRHASFLAPDFIPMLRRHGVGVVLADHAEHPVLYDPAALLVYARLQAASEAVSTGYPERELAVWAKRARSWAAGKQPAGLPKAPVAADLPKSREVFIYMINGFKPNAPAAARALLAMLP